MRGLVESTEDSHNTLDTDIDCDVGFQRYKSTSYLYLDVTEEDSDSDTSSTTSLSSTSTVVNVSLQTNHLSHLLVLANQRPKSAEHDTRSAEDNTGGNAFTQPAKLKEIVTKQDFENIRPQSRRQVDEIPAHISTFCKLSESSSGQICPNGEERARLFDRWRRQALDFISNRRHVFIFEVFTVRECLLQVKMSANGTTISLNTVPWSIRTGRSITTEDVKKRAKRYDSEIDTVLKKQNVEFSPSRLVRFVLNNSKGVPSIVSSNFANLMKRRHCKTLIEYFVYRNILPGSQRCRHQDCNRMASAVQLDNNSLEPAGIYCSKHALELNLDENVMLYNPLLVAFTPNEKNVVISAMDVEEVYGPRYGYWPLLPKGAKPIPLPGTWTPLCKKKQFRRLSNTERPIEMFYETAKNVLECAPEHFRRGTHFCGVDVRHSITCCLLSTFLKCGDSNSLCGFSFNDRPSKEDLPYNWSKVSR